MFFYILLWGILSCLFSWMPSWINQLEKLAAEETKKTTFISFKCGYHRAGLYEYSLGSFISSVYSTFLVFETLPGGHLKLTKNFLSIPALNLLDSFVLGRSREFSSNFILHLNKLSIHVTLELLCKIVDKRGLSSLIWQRHFRSLTKLGHVINLRTVSSCRQTILFIFTSAKVF